MKVALVKLALTLALGLFGLTPYWCDSCGEVNLADDCWYCDHVGE